MYISHYQYINLWYVISIEIEISTSMYISLTVMTCQPLYDIWISASKGPSGPPTRNRSPMIPNWACLNIGAYLSYHGIPWYTQQMAIEYHWMENKNDEPIHLFTRTQWQTLRSEECLKRGSPSNLRLMGVTRPIPSMGVTPAIDKNGWVWWKVQPWNGWKLGVPPS